MAKLILKAPYYRPGSRTETGSGRGGYAQYIGTREGVEIQNFSVMLITAHIP